MDLPNITIAPLYAALLGLLFIPITIRVGLRRVGSKISIGDGGDPEMLRRIRGQANFTETVPLALILLFTVELLGASSAWLHGLGACLLVGRILHYIGLTEIGPGTFRPLGMVMTLLAYLIPCVWILVHIL